MFKLPLLFVASSIGLVTDLERRSIPLPDSGPMRAAFLLCLESLPERYSYDLEQDLRSGMGDVLAHLPTEPDRVCLDGPQLDALFDRIDAELSETPEYHALTGVRSRIAQDGEVVSEAVEPHPDLLDRGRIRTPGHQMIVAKVPFGPADWVDQVRVQRSRTAPVIRTPRLLLGMIDVSPRGIEALKGMRCEREAQTRSGYETLRFSNEGEADGSLIRVGFRKGDPRPRFVHYRSAPGTDRMNHMTYLRYGSGSEPSASVVPSGGLMVQTSRQGSAVTRFAVEDLRLGEERASLVIPIDADAHLYDERAGGRAYYGPGSRSAWPANANRYLRSEEPASEPLVADERESPEAAEAPVPEHDGGRSRFLLMVAVGLAASGLALVTSQSHRGGAA